MTAPIPEEFTASADTYESIPPMWVQADFYRDGKLLHARMAPVDDSPEQAPGWTVQGTHHGEAA